MGMMTSWGRQSMAQAAWARASIFRCPGSKLGAGAAATRQAAAEPWAPGSGWAAQPGREWDSVDWSGSGSGPGWGSGSGPGSELASEPRSVETLGRGSAWGAEGGWGQGWGG